MIVVTGANGQLGRAVVERLLDRGVPAERIVASVRDPAEAASLVARGIDVRAGDFGEPDRLAAAFAGASQVLLVSPNDIDKGLRWTRAAIAAARAAGARRVLYTSHMGTHATSPFHHHHDVEAVLVEGGTPFTSLRHGFYAESALHLVGGGFAAGDIRVPEDGPVNWTTRADLAEADAVVLAEEGRLDGISPPLTAPEALTMAELAAIASELTGREVRRTVVSDAAYRDAKIAEGVPANMADMLVEVFRDARRGVFAATDPTLATLLGRRPRTMRDVLSGLLAPAGA